MAKATFVKKARKDQPQWGIKAGDSYWWWQFAFGQPICSKTKPKRSQLTQSEFLGWLYDLEDGDFAGLSDDENLKDEVEAICNQIDEQISELQGKLDNMPEQLQESSVLNTYIEGLESWKSDLEQIDFDDFDEDAAKKEIEEALRAEGTTDEADFDSVVEQRLEEAKTEHWSALRDEAMATGYSG